MLEFHGPIRPLVRFLPAYRTIHCYMLLMSTVWHLIILAIVVLALYILLSDRLLVPPYVIRKWSIQ